jgi:hypothetical protein
MELHKALHSLLEVFYIACLLAFVVSLWARRTGRR